MVRAPKLLRALALLTGVLAVAGCVRSAATLPKAQDTQIPSPVVVALLGGFMAPADLYQTFAAAARASGATVVQFTFPDKAGEFCKQDSMLRRVAADLAKALKETGLSGQTPQLLLFGHSIGGKLAAHLAMAPFVHDGVVGGSVAADVPAKADLELVQRSLKGLFLLDPVEAGMDTELTTRFDAWVSKGAVQNPVPSVTEPKPSCSIFSHVDRTMVRLRTEKMVPVPSAEPGSQGKALRFLVVRADRGEAPKSLHELTKSVQLLRPPSDNRLVQGVWATESGVASFLDGTGIKAIPSCAPVWKDTKTKTTSSGPALFYEMLARRKPLDVILADAPAATDQERGSGAVTLVELGLTDDKRLTTSSGGYGSKPWKAIPNDQPGVVVVADSGHMDLVDMQPYQKPSHRKFFLMCPVGSGFLKAMENANLPEQHGSQKGNTQPSLKGKIANPSAATVLNLWERYLGLFINP